MHLTYMKKLLLFSFFFFTSFVIAFIFWPRRDKKFSPAAISHVTPPQPVDFTLVKIKKQAAALRSYAAQKHFSTQYCFLIDMHLPSGKNRFFVYDLERDTTVLAGLVAHGSCNAPFANEASFNNTPRCGCSSIGKYKIGYAYKGRFSTSFKLFGIDSTNDNAFERNVVLHAYDCVPDHETYPYPICNSLGCPMVSYKFLNALSNIITRSKQPILLWIYQ